MPLLLFLITGLVTIFDVGAQDISKLKDEKPFTISGGVGMSSSTYWSNQKYKVRDPFAWSFNANLTPTIYGFSFPFTAVVTQYTQSYSAPFTQLGISPTYKWISVHLGYRSMNLSPLVYSGNTFLGVGVELKPKYVQFAAFNGRLNKSISIDTTIDQRIQPQYSRSGQGFKLGFGNESQSFSLQYFHAKDDEGSVFVKKDSLNQLTPQENSVLGGSWKFTFFKKLYFTGDVAASLLSHDIRFNSIEGIGDIKIPRGVNKIAPINYSSVFSYAGQAMMNLNLKWFGVSAGYKRAEQDFKSLGVPYAINDLEMITASAKTSLFKNKLSINLSGNSQENNLSNNRSSTIQSRTGNANFNALLNKKLNTNLNITAVNIYQKDGLMELTDSTRMNQLMLAFNLSPSYNFGGNVYQNSIGANVSYTNLNDKNLLSREYTNGENISTSVNYNLSMNKIDASFFSMLSYSVYKQTAGGYKSTGLTLGANKSFLEKKNFSTNGSIGYFFNSSDFSDASNNLTFALGSSYNYKKHNFGLSSSYTYTPPINLNPLNTINIYRIPYAVNSKIFTASINYSYRF